MAQVAAHLSITELEERFRTAKDPILARHAQVIWLLAQGHTTAQGLGGDQLRATLDRSAARPLQCRGRPRPGRPAPAQRARSERAEAGPAGAAARAPGRSAARRRAVDEPEGGAVAGRRARARDGLVPTRLGGPAANRLVDPEAAPAAREGGDARAGS